MEREDLDYVEEIRWGVMQGRPYSAEAVGELLRIVDNLRQTISEVCAERDALKAWRDAVPVGALKRYHVETTRTKYGDNDAIHAWLTTLDGAQ